MITAHQLTARDKIILACHRIIEIEMVAMLLMAGYAVFAMILGWPLDFVMPLPARLAMALLLLTPPIVIALEEQDNPAWWVPIPAAQIMWLALIQFTL